jgi:hypothetical protein
MNNESSIKNSILAFVTYKPKEGKTKELLELIRKHRGILRKYELITSKPGFAAQSQDGTLIEVFEWAGKEAIDSAHQHPAVMDIWEKMTLVADFTLMKDLPEAARPFPGFSIVNVE